MVVLALVLIGVWLSVAAVLRTVLHARRSGGAEIVRIRDRPGSAAWWARLVATAGFALAVTAPTAELLGWAPIAFLDRLPLRLAGGVIFWSGSR